MTRKNLFLCFGVLILAVTSISCSSHRNSQQTTPSSAREQLSYNDQQRIQDIYLEASKQRILGNKTEAFELLKQCELICSEIPEVLFDEAIYELGMRQDSSALLKFEKACALDPKNTFYVETLASYYLNSRDRDKALPYLEQLADLQPSRSDVLSQLVSIYVATERSEDAIQTLNKIESIEGILPTVSYQKFLLYKGMKEEEKAFSVLDSLCKEYPHEMSYRLMIAEELLKVDKIDEAKNIYEEVKRVDPNNDNLKISLLELYKATQQDSLYILTRDTLIHSQKTTPEVRIALLREYITEEIKNDSIGKVKIKRQLQEVDSLFPDDLNLLQFQAAYLATYESQNDSDFVQIMERMYEVEPQNTQTLFFLMQYYGEHQQYVQLEDICRKGVLLHPEELVCHFYLGIACFQQNKKEEAIQAFQDGIVQKKEDSKPTMVAELFSVMGDILHEAGRKEEAYAAYDSCLTYQDNKTMCLNNYAYFLSLENRDLDKAEEMSYRTIRLEPQNATFIDTYAWVLFMKEEYAEAQTYIDKICNPTLPDSVLQADSTLSGVVFEHAGDIAAKNNNMEQALRFWKLAQERNDKDISAVLPKKIKLKKYIKP